MSSPLGAGLAPLALPRAACSLSLQMEAVSLLGPQCDTLVSGGCQQAGTTKGRVGADSRSLRDWWASMERTSGQGPGRPGLEPAWRLPVGGPQSCGGGVGSSCTRRALGAPGNHELTGRGHPAHGLQQCALSRDSAV